MADISATIHRLKEAVSFDVGYTIPDISDLKHAEVEGNIIIAPKNLVIGSDIVCDFHGCTGNTVIIGRNTRLRLHAHFLGQGGIVCISGESAWPGTIGAYLRGQNQIIYLGQGCGIDRADFLALGDDRHIVIGDLCIMASGVSVRTHDQHGIVDLETGLWLNRPADVRIEPRVWLGKDASIHKGVTVGSLSVVGERSIVTRDVPRKSIVAGAPARVIRSGVGWTFELVPSTHAAGQLNEFEAKLHRSSAVLSDPSDVK